MCLQPSAPVLGPLPKAVAILPRAIRSRDQRGIFEQEPPRPRTGSHSPTSSQRGNAQAVTRAIAGSPPSKGATGLPNPTLQEPSTHPRSCNFGTQWVSPPGSVPVTILGFRSAHLPPIPWKTLPLSPNRNSFREGTLPPHPGGSAPPSSLLKAPTHGASQPRERGQAQVCGIPRLGGARAGERAVTLWSATPRYPSNGRGAAGIRGLEGGLLSADGCALPVAPACCCCCCGGRSFWPPRLLYTSNKLVHMVVSAKHTARPWRIRVFILGTSFVRNPQAHASGATFSWRVSMVGDGGAGGSDFRPAASRG